MSSRSELDNLQEIARDAIQQALSAGATDAECTLAEGSEFSANVRMGELETLKEAGSRGAGLRVLIGKKTGSSYTSDLTPEGVRQMVAAAVELAALTTEDPHVGLPETSELGSIPGDLRLFSEDVAKLPAAQKIDAARRAEAAALAYDPRITKSEGGSFESSTASRIFANSRGFSGAYAATWCSLTAVPVASQGEAMERDYWYSLARDFAGLEDPESVGRRDAIDLSVEAERDRRTRRIILRRA